MSKFATAMVALNRLKKHFTQIHRHLNSGQFIYETVYQPDGGTSPLPSPPSQPPANLERKQEKQEEVVVYQCPAMLKKTKGGQERRCGERMLDANALR